MKYHICGYSHQVLDNVEIICFDKKIYVMLTICIHVLDWYHFCIDHPGGSRLRNNIRKVCYWGGLVT